ncbi:MAG: NUDIX hydrolase [Candidatus Kapaibacteriota bacterium]|jgi:8-oxo-dGTP pyrophosphatase MutT (NUDIX family)
MISRWETLETTVVADLKIFTAKSVQRRHPKRDTVGTFYVLDSAAWVNIIPLTPDNQVVMIRQYRHGTDSVTLEVPGGLVERGENPSEAGMRECREETGYAASESALLLGVNDPNPAFMNNECHSYLWRDCTLQHAQAFDEFEDIDVELVPLARIPQYIADGTIKHSLTLTAFFFYTLKFGGFA